MRTEKEIKKRIIEWKREKKLASKLDKQDFDVAIFELKWVLEEE
jgi:hypothetical protein